jgi:hypothetical protein
MSVIEWPPGSGRRAAYAPHEREFMRGLVFQRDADLITTGELTAQIDVIHDLKVELDARMVRVS